MTSQERIQRMFQHREADRIPIVDVPWEGTLRRWVREGMPAGMDWRDYFAVDKIASIGVDVSPRYPRRVLEETERYIISSDEWGVTKKEFRELDSTPESLHFQVSTPEAWEEAKARMTPTPDRIDWKYLEENYPRWKAEGQWIQGIFWFGFDVTHSHMVGTETLLVAMLEDPDWVSDMFNTYLDMNIALFDMIWEAGYRFDSIFWYDDMGYKNTPFFSNQLYRELLQPVHKRAVQWAKDHGLYAHLHSCGDIMPLIPDVLETGVDALNPIEIKAGMDIRRLKEEYGDRLVLHGGVNAMLMPDAEKTVAMEQELLPLLKEKGGYIFSSDHSIPNAVSLETYRRIVEAAKEYGKY